jgi:lysophospholipase L1-like esterase
MKNILAFGDSLTWGFKAGEWTRHPFEVRWPNVLAKGLGGQAHVIEEGHNGRTTIYDDGTCLDNRKGSDALPILLATHQPLDLVIIFLGTNDIKFTARCRAFDARLGMTRLVEITRSFGYLPAYKAPEVLIVSPPPLCETKDEFFSNLWNHAIEESKLFAHHYAILARETGVHFFDAGSVAKTDPTDGGHLDAANTRAIGDALVPVVKGILALD